MPETPQGSTKPADLRHSALAFGVGVVYFFPVIWMLLAAFKTREDQMATPPKLIFTPELSRISGPPFTASRLTARKFSTRVSSGIS